MNILEWETSLVEISAELDPAAPTPLRTLVLLVLPLYWCSAARPAWQTGRESSSCCRRQQSLGISLPRSSGDSVKPLLCFEQPRGFGLVLQGSALPCSAHWASGAVSPASGHVLGSVLGLGRGLASWGHKSHFAHMLHPSSVSSVLSSALLPCTRRGKVIFCLKHYYFSLIYVFIPEGNWIVLSPWKRGAGAPGGRVGNP